MPSTMTVFTGYPIMPAKIHSNGSRIVFLALLTLAAVLPGGAPAAQSNGPVPFLNVPASRPALRAPAPAARACAAADLQAQTGRQGARRGYATQEIKLTNRGTQACYLTGTPELGLGPKGAAQAIARHPNAPAALQERTDLAPGDTALVLVGTPGSCDAAIGPERKVNTHLQVGFPGGGAASLEGAHVDTLCGEANVLDMQVLHAEHAPAALAQLQGAVHLEGRAMPGSELHYTVVLTNPTARAISLTPCPSFTQSLFGDREVTSATLRLNCAATGNVIPAGQSVTYEMRLAIPAHVEADAVKLSWQLEDGPTAGTNVALREVAR